MTKGALNDIENDKTRFCRQSELRANLWRGLIRYFGRSSTSILILGSSFFSGSVPFTIVLEFTLPGLFFESVLTRAAFSVLFRASSVKGFETAEGCLLWPGVDVGVDGSLLSAASISSLAFRSSYSSSG